ncbi:MAG: hypothetical protein ACE5KF_10280 [Kiloniellaceae bacterium]
MAGQVHPKFRELADPDHIYIEPGNATGRYGRPSCHSAAPLGETL